MSMTTTKKAFGWQLILLLSMTAVLTGPLTILPAQESVPPGFRAYSLRHAQATEIAPQLQKLLNDLGTRQEVLIDQSVNRLLIRGPEQSAGLVEHLVQTLDRPAVANATTALTPPTVPASPASTAAAATAPTHTLRHVTWQELEEQLARHWGGRLLRSVSRDGEVATIHAQAPEGPSPVLRIDRRGDTVSFLGSATNAQGWV
jgi:hypothetical protein